MVSKHKRYDAMNTTPLNDADIEEFDRMMDEMRQFYKTLDKKDRR